MQGGGQEVAKISYSKRGVLLLVNEGARAADEVGFRYCEKCRAWISGDDSEQDHVDPNSGSRCPAGAEPADIHHEVLLYHKGHHDFLLIEMAVPDNQDAERFGWSLLYALSYGFQVAFSADESEVSGHVFLVPGNAARIRLLLYEQDEGGAGLLRNLVDHSAWQRVATRALEIVHVDPATGQGHGRGLRYRLLRLPVCRSTTSSITGTWIAAWSSRRSGRSSRSNRSRWPSRAADDMGSVPGHRHRRGAYGY